MIYIESSLIIIGLFFIILGTKNILKDYRIKDLIMDIFFHFKQKIKHKEGKDD